MKLKVRELPWASFYSFYCPGCRDFHVFEVRTDGHHPSWAFDGNLESPTFNPSLLYPDRRCHLFVRNGKIEYCGDCTHELAGQTVDLPDRPDWTN